MDMAKHAFYTSIPTYIPPVIFDHPQQSHGAPLYQPSTPRLTRSRSKRVLYADDPWNSKGTKAYFVLGDDGTLHLQRDQTPQKPKGARPKERPRPASEGSSRHQELPTSLRPRNNSKDLPSVRAPVFEAASERPPVFTLPPPPQRPAATPSSMFQSGLFASNPPTPPQPPIWSANKPKVTAHQPPLPPLVRSAPKRWSDLGPSATFQNQRRPTREQSAEEPSPIMRRNASGTNLAAQLYNVSQSFQPSTPLPNPVPLAAPLSPPVTSPVQETTLPQLFQIMPLSLQRAPTAASASTAWSQPSRSNTVSDYGVATPVDDDRLDWDAVEEKFSQRRRSRNELPAGSLRLHGSIRLAEDSFEEGDLSRKKSARPEIILASPVAPSPVSIYTDDTNEGSDEFVDDYGEIEDEDFDKSLTPANLIVQALRRQIAEDEEQERIWKDVRGLLAHRTGAETADLSRFDSVRSTVA